MDDSVPSEGAAVAPQIRVRSVGALFRRMMAVERARMLKGHPVPPLDLSARRRALRNARHVVGSTDRRLLRSVQ